MGTNMSPKLKPFHCLKCILSIIVLVAVLIENTSANVCSDGCPTTGNKPGKLRFVQGNVYTYDLSSDTTVYLSGNDAQETTLKLQAQVQLYAGANCQYTLRLNKVLVHGPDHKKNQLGNEFTKPIQFTLANDEISSQICTDPNDNSFSLNIKRAVVSMIQSADNKRTETDLFGVCPTTISSTKSGDTIILTKSRNLNDCGHRENLATGLIHGVFNENSAIKTTPLLNGDYSSEQRIKNGILTNVQLSEEYQYLPFSSGEAGAKVKVVSKLHYKATQQAASPKLADGRQRTILFENPNPQPLVNVNNVKNALKEAVVNFHGSVSSKAASQFIELIRLMRFAKKDDLLALYQQVKAGTVHDQKELARQIFFDALFRCGTSDSVQVIAQLLRTELTAKEQQLAYISLNFVKAVDDSALPAISKLLDGNPPREAFLSVGNLVNKYCQDHSCENNEIKSISDKFMTKLGDCRADNRKKENNIIAILKGIRNTKHLLGQLSDRVIQCTNEKHSTRVRVAALQALTAGACNTRIQDAALQLLKNRNVDSELRIEAYLVLVTCPSGSIANELQTILNEETVYQVGSFITSQLASLRSSVDLYREPARQYFANVRSSQKFPSDFRRYSFNQELSYSIGSLGLGASADATVIYSEKEFVPRSSRFNLTGELFGNSFNILEVAARQENVDLLLEHYFGPKGTLSNVNLQNAYDSYFGDKESGKTKRTVRSVKEEIAQFAKQVNLNGENNEAINDIDYDVSIKFFGTEMYFLSLDDDLSLEPSSFIKTLKDSFNTILSDAKGFNQKTEKHALFLDTELVYPSGVGLPLKLLLQGSSVFRFEVGGKIDLKKIHDDPKNAKLNVKLVPSYNVDINGVLSVDGYAVTTGLQVSGSVHSSTGVDLDVALLNNGNGINVNLKTPFKKQEIFSFDHKIVFITQERGQETVTNNLKFSSKKQEFNACFDQISKYVGTTFCVDVSATLPGNTGIALFPLNGGNKASISLEVEQAYNFQALYDNTNNHPSLELQFDTPGSQIPRNTKLTLEAAIEPKPYAKITFDSPHRKALIETGFLNDPNELILYANAENGPEKYYGKIGFTKSGAAPKERYTPIFLLQTPNKEDQSLFGYRLAGDILKDSSKSPTQYTFNNIQVIGSTDPEPITLNGHIEVDTTKKLASDLTISKGNRKGTLAGSLEYSLYDVLHFDYKLTSNLDERANGKLKLDIERKEKNLKTDVLLIFGSDFNTKTKRVEFSQDYSYELDDKKSVTAVVFKNKLAIPFVPLNVKANGEYNEKLVKYDVEIGSNKYKFNTNLDAKVNTHTAGDYDINFDIALNKNNAKLLAKRDIDVQAQKSRLTNKLTASTGTRVELNGVVSNQPTPTNTDINLNGLLIAADGQEPIKLTIVVLLTPEAGNVNTKLTHGSNDLLNVNALVKHNSNNCNGELDLAILNLFNGKGSFKSVSGKGDANLIVDVPKINRKLKLETEFNVVAPLYELKNILYYNYERDNTKKITLETNNKVTKTDFTTKNTLEIEADKYELNVDAKRSGEIDEGKITSRTQIILPTKRQFTIELDREVNFKNDKANGKLHLKLVDARPNQKPVQLTIDSKLSDGNYKAQLFELFTKFEFINANEQNLIIDTNIKNLPNGHFKTAAASLTVRGSAISEVIDFLISADEYCPEHAVYRLTAKYGGKVNANVNGNYHVGGRGKPGTYDVDAQISLPNTDLKSIRLKSNGMYLVPQTGDGLYEGKFKVIGSLNDQQLSIDTTIKGNGKHGSGNLNINLPKLDPLSVEGTYSFESSGDENQPKTHTVLSWQCQIGPKRTIKGSFDLTRVPGEEATLQATLETPLDKVKKIDYNYHGKKLADNSYKSDSTLNVDDKTYSLNTVLSTSQDEPSIELTVSYPGKTSKFYASSKRLADRKYKQTLGLENFGDFNFVGENEFSYQSADSFYVIVDINSAKLNIKKGHLEIQSKPTGGSKGVEFKASLEDKHILSGSIEYNVKEEKGKTIIEGEGNLKIYDQNKPATFSLVRNIVDDAKDGEKGTQLVFTGGLGAQNIHIETRLTNKVFHIRNTVCEEKNQCINFEIKTVTRRNPPNEYKHELIIAIDLRKFGYAYEFGLQSDTERNGFAIKHNFDMHLQAQDKTKYQYKSYIDSNKAGVILTLPSRVIAVESVYQIPKELLGQYEISVSSYLDKQNKPNAKATLGFLVNLTKPNKNEIKSRSELKFSHPSVRELKIIGETNFNGDTQTASGRLQLDIFKTTDQAIVIQGRYGNIESASVKAFNISSELGISSKGLQFEYTLNGHVAASLDKRQISASGSLVSPSADYRTTLYVFTSDQKIELLVIALNEELLHLDGSFDTNKMNILLNSKLKYFASTPLAVNLNVQGFTSFVLTISKDPLFNLNGEFSVGKETSLLLKGNGKELVRGKVALDQANFLSSEYKINDADIKTFIEKSKDEIKADASQAKKTFTERLSKTKELLEKQLNTLKASTPDFNQIRDEYKKEYEKIFDELLQDKTIKVFVDLFNNVFGTIGNLIIEITKVLFENAKKVFDIFAEFYEKLQDAFNSKILPAIKETYSKIEVLLSQIYEDLLHFVGAVFERLAKTLKAFEGDFEKLGKSLSETFKTLAQVFTKYFEIIRKELYDLYGLIEPNIKELPGFEYLKEKLNTSFGGIFVPENIINVMKEITNTLKDTLPTMELNDFVQKLSNYVENKLTNKKVNDLEAIKELYVSLVKAVKSVLDLIRAQAGELPDALNGSTTLGPLPFSLAALKRLPQLSSVRFSLFNYIRNEDLPNIRDIIYTYRPFAFNPLNLLPPLTKRATVIDGQHILTFDGKQITFAGNCQYVLAQDFLNGNFSLVINLADGKLKSLTLLDKEDSIELAADGKVSLNNKPSDLPIHKANIHGFRGYHTVTLLTTYGATVVCSPDLRFCHVTVNGFYHNRVRGLLGNANNEPNDDLILPTGKLATNDIDFGNAYKIQKTCAAIPVTEHTHVRDERCTKTFSLDSPLRYCYYFIDPNQYRKACDHDLSALSDAQKEEAACNWSRAYVSACVLENIPIRIPKSCVKCDGKYNIDEQYKVSGLQKKADIVLVVDTSIGASTLNEFVQPLIVDLRKELKSRDIVDTKIAVIGYNNDEKYLTHFTTNGQLDFNGKFNAIKLDESPKVAKPIKTNNEQWNKYIDDTYNYVRTIEKDLGLSADGKAFREAMEYPFRSSATNVIIAIRPDQLEYSANPIKLLGATLSNTVAQLVGISVHVIAPVNDLALTKEPKNTKNIVGFSNDGVILLADAKKRGFLGSKELRATLDCDSDMGVDLVLQGDGFVFPLNNYQQLKSPKDKKQFISTVAATLAEQTSRTEIESNCVCILKYGLFASEMCLADEKRISASQKKVK